MLELVSFPRFWEWAVADWYDIGAKVALWASATLIILHKVEPRLVELVPKEPPRRFWFFYGKFVIICSIFAINTRRNDEFASNTITVEQLNTLHQIAFERGVSLFDYIEAAYPGREITELTKREASDSFKGVKEWARRKAVPMSITAKENAGD